MKTVCNSFIYGIFYYIIGPSHELYGIHWNENETYKKKENDISTDAAEKNE